MAILLPRRWLYFIRFDAALAAHVSLDDAIVPAMAGKAAQLEARGAMPARPATQGKRE